MSKTLTKKAEMSDKNPRYCYKCGTRLFESIRCSCFKGNYRYSNKVNVTSCVTGINFNNRSKLDSQKFTRSKEWKILKKEIIRLYGGICMKCGFIGRVHVDHIKPKSKYPRRKLDPTNLQVLCEPCNLQKSNVLENDYRTKEQKDLLNRARSKNKLIRHHWPRPKHVQKKMDERDKKKEALEQERLLRIASRPKILLRKRNETRIL